MSIENTASTELKLDTTGSKELSQEEIKAMFDDQFFADLENNDAKTKILKEEINWKVYFEKPNTTDKYDIRQLWSTIDQNFVDKFFGLNAIAGRIELGTSSKSKPEFYNGKKVIVNDKGVFYKWHSPGGCDSWVNSEFNWCQWWHFSC